MAFRTYTQEVVDAGEDLRGFTANSAIKQGQLVTLAGDYAVDPSSTDGESALGFAAYDAAAGEEVLVALDGTEVLATSGTGAIAAGDLVTSHGGTGEPGEVATAATGDYPIGVALEADSGDGDDVRVYVQTGGQSN